MRLIPLLALSCLASPAQAQTLPVQGAFGMTATDCKAARDENEGAYLVFEGLSVGHGGQGGCDFRTIRKTGPDRWALVGLCSGLESAKVKKTIVMARHGKFEIEYDGARYKQCGQ